MEVHGVVAGNDIRGAGALGLAAVFHHGAWRVMNGSPVIAVSYSNWRIRIAQWCDRRVQQSIDEIPCFNWL